MDLDLADKAVIVTGGASHIGRQIAFGFAAEGARIAILDLDERQLERTAREAKCLGALDVHAITADIASHRSATEACGTAITALGGVDVLINNVGWAGKPCSFLEVDPGSWDQFTSRNLHSAMFCVRAALPTMIAQGYGSIVSTASMAAFGTVTESVYGAAKAGLVSFTRTIAGEYGPHGIRANCVAPGFVLPEDPDSIGEQSLWKDGPGAHISDKVHGYIVKTTPLRRLSTTTDIANATLFLASDRASRQITGDVFSVAGGVAR